MTLEKKRGSIKKGISLSRAQEEHVASLAKELNLSFSRVVQEALTFFAKHLEAIREEKLYRQYYEDSKNIARHKKLADDLWLISRRAFKNR